MFDDIQTITEVVSGADFNESSHVVKEVNKYLAAGWKLLAIHQRGWDDTHIGENSIITTVYILGHQNPDAERPEAEEEHLPTYLQDGTFVP